MNATPTAPTIPANVASLLRPANDVQVIMYEAPTIIKDGLFIVLEGVEASGKTSQAARLVRWLGEQNYTIQPIRCPGQTAFGKGIREIVLNDALPIVDPYVKELLHIADLRETTTAVIGPAFDAGHIVVADRYADSTRAYAIGGCQLDATWVEEHLQDNVIEPDRVLFLDLPLDVAMGRLAARGVQDKADEKGAEFFGRVAMYYQSLLLQNPETWVLIDAAQSKDAVFGQIRHAVQALLDALD